MGTMAMKRVLVMFGMLVSLALPAQAGQGPTEDEVRDLTLRAAALVAEQGVEPARKIFHAPGAFRHGEIYVNVIDENGSWIVYPPNPRNEGKSVLNVIDADGVPLVREIIRIAVEKGEGWVNYRWLNPVSNRIEPKASYVKRVPARGVIVYIGHYR